MKKRAGSYPGNSLRAVFTAGNCLGTVAGIRGRPPLFSGRPACVHAFFERGPTSAGFTAHQAVFHKGISHAVEKAQHLGMVAVTAFFQQAADVLTLIKAVKGKLGARHAGGHVAATHVRVLSHFLSPLADLPLPLLAPCGLVLQQALFQLQFRICLPGLLPCLPGVRSAGLRRRGAGAIAACGGAGRGLRIYLGEVAAAVGRPQI